MSLIAGRKPGLAYAIIWLLLAGLLLFLSRDNVATLSGWDPDDQLRLVQLRDFLGGQSWWDSSQYRLNAPDGGPMHWSRLIELPLAAIILALRPLLGTYGAEMAAGIIVPLGCYALIAAVLANIAARIAGHVAGVSALMMAMVAPALSMQLRPMRIDHHGWQLVCAAIALWTLFWPKPRRAGLLLGLALAVWMHISLEGAPAAVMFFALLAFGWVRDAGERPRLQAAITAFALTSLALFFATQRQGLSGAQYCDAISPAHIWAIIAAALSALAVTALLLARWPFRLAALALPAGFAGGLFVYLAPDCLSGAFAQMDPMVRKYWYAQVNEGLPVWRQDAATALLFLGVAIASLACLPWLRWQLAPEKWALLVRIVPLQIYAIMLSMLVFRTISVATLLAIPALACAATLLIACYREEPVLARRLRYVALFILLLMPGALLQQAYLFFSGNAAETAPAPAAGAQTYSCDSAQSIATLASLPPSRMVAPFDIGPMILLTSAHKVLASSHHRNQQGMRDQIDIFRLPPAQSKAIIDRRGIAYIVACPDESELGNYSKADPDGLWAGLAKGRVPAWLERLPDRGSGIQVWRVRKP
jgi:hypothetical protein